MRKLIFSTPGDVSYEQKKWGTAKVFKRPFPKEKIQELQSYLDDNEHGAAIVVGDATAMGWRIYGNIAVLFSENYSNNNCTRVEAYARVGSFATRVWQPNETLPRERRCILIRHKRGTWIFPEDQDNINCVVVFYGGTTYDGSDRPEVDYWKEFGPDTFKRDEIEQWCELPGRDLGIYVDKTQRTKREIKILGDLSEKMMEPFDQIMDKAFDKYLDKGTKP